MAMGTERSKALHNFTMPCGLRWGNQRFLRCMKVNSDGQVSPLHSFTNNDSDSSDQHLHSIQQRRTTRDRYRERDSSSSDFLLLGSQKKASTSPPAFDGSRGSSDEEDVGMASMREKVMFDLQTSDEKIKDAKFEGLEEGEVSDSPPLPPPIQPPPVAASVEGETSRRCSLRTRRATCKTPVSGFVSGLCGGAAAGGSDGCGNGKGLRLDLARPSSGPPLMRVAAVIDKSPRLRSSGSGAAPGGEKRERAKFTVSLSKGEIEEDFLAMVGHRPRRPKKRAKVVQKQLDTLFPGLWLTEVTPEMYKVPELAP